MCRVIAPCCGQDRDYCECSEVRRAKAALVALAEIDCPPVVIDPARDYGEPPF